MKELFNSLSGVPVHYNVVLTFQVVSSGEPSFSSLGLGSYTPVGIIQNCMEFLHISCDLPWWGSIVIGKLNNKNIFYLVLFRFFKLA